MKRLGLVFFALVFLSSLGLAQDPDLWDDTTLRTFKLTFHQPDWWDQLKANKNAKIHIEADLEVDGTLYTDVGVRFRGKSSFGAGGTQKKPFKIKMDHFVPGQELYGFDSLRLNNGFADPSWVRESVMSNLLVDYMPMARQVYIVLEINGQNWGPYVLEQQKDNTWMEEFFGDDQGNRYRSVAGHGFTWEGPNWPAYDSWYDLMNPPGNDPWSDMIEVCDVLNNFNPVGKDLTAELQPLLNIDGLAWMLAGDNAFGNNDSYAGNANNWYLVHDMRHDRMEVINHDLGLSFGTWDNFGPDLSIIWGFGHPDRPLASRVMKDVNAKREYFAHLRTLNEEVLRWDVIGPLVQRYQDLIDAEVQADPKRIYTYEQFKDNIDETIDVGIWFADAIRPYVEDRHAYLSSLPRLTHPQVEFDEVRVLPSKPDPGEAIAVQVRAVGPNTPSKIALRWRVRGHFESIGMKDDGVSADGQAGDGLYGAWLPPQMPGVFVQYYFVGTESVTGARSFLPNKAEYAPFSFPVAFGGVGLRITEYMYSGDGGEFIELTNTSAAPIDLAGWSLDDASANAGTYDLSAAGVLPPGESFVVTEADSAPFRSSWNLAGSITVLGSNASANLGRNDAIHVYDDTGVVQDRLVFGDEDFPGSARARDAGAWACTGGLGEDDPYLWRLAASGDEQGSWSSSGGALGSPGLYVSAACALGEDFCSSNPNSTGQAATLIASGSPALALNDLTLLATSVPDNQFGYMLLADAQANVPGFGGSQGVLCLGSPIVRFSTHVLTSGATNEMSFSPDLAHLPQGTTIRSGATWSWQLWFRDTNPTSTSNTSNGLALTFW